MIERFAGLEFMRVRELVCGQAGTSRNHQALGVEQPDPLPCDVGREALLAHSGDDQVGEADGGRAGA